MAISLYIHYPYCVRKCRYCDFLSGPSNEEARQDYLRALEEEICVWGRIIEKRNLVVPSENDNRVDTIFFGGGTPSVMSDADLDHLMFVLARNFQIDDNAEITMECNPGTADAAKLRAFADKGINRLSLGVQSFDDDELKMLGRIHTADEAIRIYEEARNSGFLNINLDLMSALPGQKLEIWEQNLRTATRLNPEHISAYSLIIEDNTPLEALYSRGELPPVPEEEVDRAMYHRTKELLSLHGYDRYEISNYAKPGYACKHNAGYWTGHEYLGLGLGASSMLRMPGEENEDVYLRFHNTGDPKAYLSSYKEETQKILEEKAIGAERMEELPALEDIHVQSLEDRMEEFMFLGLRMVEGVSEEVFEKRFHQKITDVYGEVIRRHTEDGTLCRENGRVFLTERGLDVSNQVMADCILTV